MPKWYFILSFVFLVVLAGCEKVIEINLNEVNPAIVIEATLTDKPGSAKVELSKTADYFDEFEKQMISGAQVILKDDEGNQFVLSEKESGIYTNEIIKPLIGAKYTISVETEGEVYVASSTLHPAVEIKKVDYFFENGESFFDEGYYLLLYIKDPPDDANYYRINIYKNGRLRTDGSDLILFSDRLVEGKEVEIKLRSVLFKKGSIARVELISLDKSAFDFYRTFSDLTTTNPGSAAPANPTSNFSNGALGFFSAYSFDEETVVINE